VSPGVRGERSPSTRLLRLLVCIGNATLFAIAPCAAQSPGLAGKELLRSEFWAESYPVAETGEAWPVSPDEARGRIRDEAAWVFGGMIWGFEFAYTPYDKTRALQERFDITPIGTLDPGELALAPGASPAADRAGSAGELRSFVEFRPGAALVSLMEGYANEPWKGGQGTGRADMNMGVKGRRAAYVDGLRAAVRSLLQGLEPNKPRLVRGRVAFVRPPSMAIIDGYYTARVRVRVMVIEVIPYVIY
jgi:hypothetical protein